jgi:uncharacterized repeat protein (TIGR03803 family)
MRSGRLFPQLALLVLLAGPIVLQAGAVTKYKVLYPFTGGSDGGGVFAGVAFDTKGNLYGTTSGGGAHGEGTVFELMRNARGKWAKTVLYSFCAQTRCRDGASPQSTPVFDANGNLYGTANGTSFELSPGQSGWTFNVIYDAGSSSGYTIDESASVRVANPGA